MNLYDVSFRRMGSSSSQHRVVSCANIEAAIEDVRKLFPGCLILNVSLSG